MDGQSHFVRGEVPFVKELAQISSDLANVLGIHWVQPDEGQKQIPKSGYLIPISIDGEDEINKIIKYRYVMILYLCIPLSQDQ